MKIFAGSPNRPLAEKIAAFLNIDLSPLEIHIFPDGEKRVRVLDSVVDEEVVIVQPTSPPVDQNYLELFFITDAVKRSGAKSVTLVVPYLGYQRQDHVFRGGEAVSLDVVIKTLEVLSADKILFFDLHSVRTSQLFTIPAVHLSALPLFAEKIREMVSAEVAHKNFRVRNAKKGTSVKRIENAASAHSKNFVGSPRFDNTILISPDMGGVRRTRLLSQMLSNMSYATIVKNRNLATGEVSAEEIEGLPAGRQGEIKRKAIIVDDMISSGGTIVAAADLLVKNGVEEVVVFATHAVFSDDAPQVLQTSKASKIFVTDTIEVPPKKRFPKLQILSVADMIAEELFKK